MKQIAEAGKYVALLAIFASMISGFIDLPVTGATLGFMIIGGLVVAVVFGNLAKPGDK